MKLTRRDFLKLTGATAGAAALSSVPLLPTAAPSRYGAFAVPAAAGLSDPALQPKFVALAPNALDPGFLFKDLNANGGPVQQPNFSLRVREAVQQTGLVNPKNGRALKTSIWGYGADTVSWPGQTVQVMSTSSGGADETVIRWENGLQGKKHLLPVDESLHWCYSLHGASSANGVDYRQYSIKKNGVPIITHLHGGNTDFQYDGNPEFFYSPDGNVKGPQWDAVPAGSPTPSATTTTSRPGTCGTTTTPSGITRLNVYAGLAGFYFVRDEFDTGLADNPLGLPACPYELAYAIQDRMFSEDGALFYPAFPGDPFYDDFIGEGAACRRISSRRRADRAGGVLRRPHGRQRQDLAQDRRRAPQLPHAPAQRLRPPVHGGPVPCAASPDATDLRARAPLPFSVIGSDQGLASAATQVDTLVFEPGGRYDIVVDFSSEPEGYRVIMENIGGDAPFGGDYGNGLDPGDFFPNRRPTGSWPST